MAPKARILAIDDQLYFRSFVEGVLSEAGYAVRSAESEGKLAGAQGASDSPDLLIFDPLQVGPDVPGAVARMRARWPATVLLAQQVAQAGVARQIGAGAQQRIIGVLRP